MDESSLQEEPVFNISKCESASLFCEDLDDYPSWVELFDFNALSPSSDNSYKFFSREAIASIVQSNLNIFSGFFNNEEDDKVFTNTVTKQSMVIEGLIHLIFCKKKTENQW